MRHHGGSAVGAGDDLHRATGELVVGGTAAIAPHLRSTFLRYAHDLKTFLVQLDVLQLREPHIGNFALTTTLFFIQVLPAYHAQALTVVAA